MNRDLNCNAVGLDRFPWVIHITVSHCHNIMQAYDIWLAHVRWLNEKFGAQGGVDGRPEGVWVDTDDGEYTLLYHFVNRSDAILFQLTGGTGK